MWLCVSIRIPDLRVRAQPSRGRAGCPRERLPPRTDRASPNYAGLPAWTWIGRIRKPCARETQPWIRPRSNQSWVGESLTWARPSQWACPCTRPHPPYIFTLQRRHGDTMRPGGLGSANELIVMCGHTGTHLDALAHFARDGVMCGGLEAADRPGRRPRHA